MNEIQVKTLKVEPVVIEFNKADIEKELDESLKKYKDLVFSEDNATELRKTIAELRKGKKAVDRYRIDTSKELKEPINEFEEELKELNKKFDDVIDPLVEQQNEFEEKRRAEKLEKVEKIRLEHIENYELPEEYHERVLIEDSMLTKSASLKETSGTLEFVVQKLKAEHEKKENDIQLINTTVELANAKNDLGFSADAYARLLEFKPVEEITKQVELDAENEVNKRKVEQELKERKEQEEKERLEREKHAELERIEKEKQKDMAEDEKVSQEPIIESFENNQSIPAIEELPFADSPPDFDKFMDDPFAEDPFKEEVITKVYKVSATKDTLKTIEGHLDDIGISFEVIE